MPRPIAVLNLFQTFATREDYTAATGRVCPPWDATRAPKFWEDPNALNTTEDMMVYDQVFVGFGPEGLAKWKRLFLSPPVAATVNIPPTGPGTTNTPGADFPATPVPMRALENDEIVRPGPGPMGMGAPQVWTTPELPSIEVGFSMADRDLLKKIAAKLGVSV